MSQQPQGPPPTDLPFERSPEPQPNLAGRDATYWAPWRRRPPSEPGSPPRVRPHGSWYVAPSLLVVAAVILASIGGALWARQQALSGATDALLIQGFLHDNEVGLEQGGRYRVRAAGDRPVVRCDFVADDGAPPFAWTFVVPPENRGHEVNQIGSFTAPHSGFYTVACEGAEGQLRVDPDPSGTIGNVLRTAAGVAMLALALFVGIAVARSRYRAGLAGTISRVDLG